MTPTKFWRVSLQMTFSNTESKSIMFNVVDLGRLKGSDDQRKLWCSQGKNLAILGQRTILDRSMNSTSRSKSLVMHCNPSRIITIICAAAYTGIMSVMQKVSKIAMSKLWDLEMKFEAD